MILKLNASVHECLHCEHSHVTHANQSRRPQIFVDHRVVNRNCCDL